MPLAVIDYPQTILYGQTDQRDSEIGMISRALEMIKAIRPDTTEATWLPRICCSPGEISEKQLLWVLQQLSFCLKYPPEYHLDSAYSDQHRCDHCRQSIPLNDQYIRIGEHRDADHQDLCIDCGLNDGSVAERICNPDHDILREWLRQNLDQSSS